jgi:hypothetical protein
MRAPRRSSAFGFGFGGGLRRTLIPPRAQLRWSVLVLGFVLENLSGSCGYAGIAAVLVERCSHCCSLDIRDRSPRSLPGGGDHGFSLLSPLLYRLSEIPCGAEVVCVRHRFRLFRFCGQHNGDRITHGKPKR